MDLAYIVSLIHIKGLAGKLREGAGTVYGFSDDSFLKLELQPNSATASKLMIATCTNKAGTPYEGNVNDFVDRALEEAATIGLSVDSESIREHLQATGVFEFEGERPVKYARDGRDYQVF